MSDTGSQHTRQNGIESTPISADLFREVFRQWPSGVAVATSRRNGHAHGMIVGSFCSLSSDPPLVMVSAGRDTRMHDIIQDSGLFAVSILSTDQVGIFERFAGIDRRFDDDRFVGLDTIVAETGIPILPDSLAWVDCRVVESHPGGSYTIFVGEIVAASRGDVGEASPMVYFQRRPSGVADNGVRDEADHAHSNHGSPKTACGR